MKKNDSVIMRKIAATPFGLAWTPGTYIPGEINPNLSVPIEYEVEGDLLQDIVAGNNVLMFRRKQNRIEAAGIFETTKVVSIKSVNGKITITTANSVYEVILQKEKEQ